MHEWAAYLAIFASLSAFFAVIKFWTDLSDKITQAKAVGDDAREEAKEAKDAARLAKDSVEILREAVGLFRIQVAKEYVDKDTIREVEARVIAAVRDAEKSSNNAIDALAKRIDGIADGRRS